MIRDVLRMGDPRLLRVAQPVTEFGTAQLAVHGDQASKVFAVVQHREVSRRHLGQRPAEHTGELLVDEGDAVVPVGDENRTGQPAKERLERQPHRLRGGRGQCVHVVRVIGAVRSRAVLLPRRVGRAGPTHRLAWPGRRRRLLLFSLSGCSWPRRRNGAHWPRKYSGGIGDFGENDSSRHTRRTDRISASGRRCDTGASRGGCVARGTRL